MKLHKNNVIASIGTAIIMVMLLLFLIFCGMTANTPMTEEGLTVNFGSVDLSQGLFEPYSESNSLTPQDPVPPTQASTPPPATTEVPSEQDLITQEEESVDLQAEARKKAEEEARLQEEERRRQEEEQRRLEEERRRQEQERQAADIKNQVANVFGSQRGSESDNQGSDNEALAGNQGQLQGSTESANTLGSGSGYGDFSLDGRSHMGALPRPSFNIEAEGVVVVRILVNGEGRVVSASIDLQGTDTDNMELRNAAIAAAKQAKFNAIQTKTNQAGSITYRFRLR